MKEWIPLSTFSKGTLTSGSFYKTQSKLVCPDDYGNFEYSSWVYYYQTLFVCSSYYYYSTTKPLWNVVFYLWTVWL